MAVSDGLSLLQRIDRQRHTGLMNMPLRQWVEKYYKFAPNAPFSFDGHEYLKGIYDCEAQDIAVMKSNQVGGSEWLIASGFYFLDVLGANVFYAYPTFADMQDQVKTRVDPVIRNSEHLSGLIHSKNKDNGEPTDNVRVKQLRDNFIYFRGAENIRQITSVQADAVLLDEYDRMKPANAEIVVKRMDASSLQILRNITTPTMPNYGIHKKFLAGSQGHWHIKCPYCNYWQTPEFHANLVRISESEARFVCANCGRQINRLMPGEWVHKHPDREAKSFAINKLFSARASMLVLMERYEKAMMGLSSSDDIKDIHNQDMGVPYVAPGGQLTDDILDSCAINSGYMNEDTIKGAYMGIDVQSRLMRIMLRVSGEDKIINFARTIHSTDSPDHDVDALIEIMDEFDVPFAVIDALPENRLSRLFAQRMPGRVAMAYFHGNDYKMKKRVDHDKKTRTVQINKTDVLDTVRGQFLKRVNLLPQNARAVTALYDQLKAPIRQMEVDERTGVQYGTYTKNGPDDYSMALLYAQAAMEIGKNANISFDYGQNREKGVETREIIVYFNIVDELTKEYGRSPSDEEVARALNISIEELLELKMDAEEAVGQSLDKDEIDDDFEFEASDLWFPGM